MGEIVKHLFKQLTYGLGQIILRVIQVPPDIGMKATLADPHYQPILKAEGPCLVHERCSLPDEPISDAMHRLQINLISVLTSTKRMVGRVTASAMAAASTVSVLLDLT